MLPNAAKIKKLLYISDGAKNDVYVYDYEGGAMVGALSGFAKPAGQCVDAKGDVWIVNDNGSNPTAVEYAHGGSKVLKSLDTQLDPSGCAVSPNGDLAVSDVEVTTGDGLIQVWKDASGNPASYGAKDADCYQLFPPGYDRAGVLYTWGTDASGSSWQLCELPQNGKSLRAVRFAQAGCCFESAMWDGAHMTLSNTLFTPNGDAAAIYRVATGPRQVKTVGETVLTDTCNSKPGDRVTFPFVVGEKNTPVNTTQGHDVIGANTLCPGRFGFWHYPAGGSPYKVLSSAPAEMSGYSVSIGSSTGNAASTSAGSR
jgi:hypothetical protein